MVTETAVAWYWDWKFWSVFMSAAAILLSQMPPVKHWFRRTNLSIETYGFINVGHHIGRPNVQLFLMIRNHGGRRVRVSKLRIAVQRGDRELFVQDARGYFETVNAESPLIFLPFTLAPGEEWSHLVNFFSPRDRDDERRFRAEISALQSSLQEALAEREARDPNDRTLVHGQPEAVRPITDRFEREFAWEQGEYVVEVKATIEKRGFSERFRFVLFESDRDDLRRYAEDYSKGFGSVMLDKRHSGLNIPLARGTA